MQLVQCAECGEPIEYPDYLPSSVVVELEIDDEDADVWFYRREHDEHEPVPDPEWVPRCVFFCCAYEW